MGVWVYGCMCVGVCVYGCMGIWAFGRMGVWAVRPDALDDARTAHSLQRLSIGIEETEFEAEALRQYISAG